MLSGVAWVGGGGSKFESPPGPPLEGGPQILFIKYIISCQDVCRGPQRGQAPRAPRSLKIPSIATVATPQIKRHLQARPDGYRSGHRKLGEPSSRQRWLDELYQDRPERRRGTATSCCRSEKSSQETKSAKSATTQSHWT